MSHSLVITFGDHPMQFKLEDTPITDLWLDRMSKRHAYPLDDARRFYHFNPISDEETRAVHMITECIDTINQHQLIIDRPFSSVYDKDLLNYLHNIFERYHGMLDRQNHEFWNHAPATVRQALADLNIAVHRCESLSAHRPRVVCTWFGMPKTEKLDLQMQKQYGQLGCDFGGVYLNYVEIGKTAADLARDNDVYIADEMFQPFNHFSADFVMTFYQQTADQLKDTLQQIDLYFQSHRAFFSQHGIESSDDVRMLPLRYKVAQLDCIDHEQCAIFDLIRQNQHITSVEIV